ncbi:MAG: 50S ribosomal protein L11 methyltransferase [Verrucomicrobiales bacterium]|jgi:ribosomal protein L11 methyltransferase|nr:50S ribosomal protein L11 methyltransferase [Verrucomicrobiales bacterium]
MNVWQRIIPAKWTDEWLERLAWAGPQNCAVTYLPGRKTARLEVYALTAAQRKKLTREFGGRAVSKPQASWLAPQRRAFVLPLPPWLCLAARAAAIPPKYRRLPRLIIPAGLAFGTGEHATTGLCLRQLLKHLPAGGGARVLDAGTGSGLLALAASLRGARVTAVDYDADSIATARANARLNAGVPPVTWRRADLLQFKPAGQYTLLVANLFADLLVKALPRFKQWLAAGGTLIVSGILRGQEAAVAAALRKERLTVSARFRKGKWICLVAKL